MTKVLTNKPQFIVKPLAIAVALAAVGGQSALAEEQYSIEEIIVSATRRNESVQDVPMSIDVLERRSWRIMVLEILKILPILLHP